MADNFYKLFESSTPKTINNKLIQVTAAPKPATRKKEYAKASPTTKLLVTPTTKKAAPIVTPVTTKQPVVHAPVEVAVQPNEVVPSKPKLANKPASKVVRGNEPKKGLALAATVPAAYVQSEVSKELFGPKGNVEEIAAKQNADALFAAKMAAAEKGYLYGGSNSAMESGYDGGELEGLASSVAAPKVVYTNPNVSEKAQAQFAKDMADTAGMNAFDREVWLLQNRNR